jgi:DNA end-binding protein Ku
VPRAIWKGNITFGFVEIPVALESAARSESELRFHHLDKRDMKPVGFRRVNKESGKEVAWSDIVRGYEFERGQYVVLSDEELKRANVEVSRNVEIVAFVDLAEIDLFFFEKPYFLTPLKKQSKGYALLHETLRATGKAGIAKVVLHTRQHVAAVVPHGPALALVLLRYADEMVDPGSLALEPPSLKGLKISAAELKLAAQLVDGMMEKWNPAQYRDDYRDDVLALIDRKIKTGTVEAVDEPSKDKESRRGSLVDLMPLLKKSLAAAQGTRSRKHVLPRRRKAKGA